MTNHSITKLKKLICMLKPITVKREMNFYFILYYYEVLKNALLFIIYNILIVFSYSVIIIIHVIYVFLL